MLPLALQIRLPAPSQRLRRQRSSSTSKPTLQSPKSPLRSSSGDNIIHTARGHPPQAKNSSSPPTATPPASRPNLQRQNHPHPKGTCTHLVPSTPSIPSSNPHIQHHLRTHARRLPQPAARRGHRRWRREMDVFQRQEHLPQHLGRLLSLCRRRRAHFEGLMQRHFQGMGGEWCCVGEDVDADYGVYTR